MPTNESELTGLKSQIASLSHKLDAIQADRLYIEDFYVKKARKKELRRKKEEERPRS